MSRRLSSKGQSSLEDDDDSDIESENDVDNKPEEKTEETYPVKYSQLFKINGPEWRYILIGCIAAIIVGATLPAFAILFGEVYGVNLNDLLF